jgi:hypothetical protein
MFWGCDHKLINDISQAIHYDTTKRIIILMEDNDTPPGFVKLQLLTSPQDNYITASAVPVNDRVYISSLFWQQNIFNVVYNRKLLKKVTSHSPCAYAYYGSIEHA